MFFSCLAVQQHIILIVDRFKLIVIIKCHKCRVKELVSILLAAIIISIKKDTTFSLSRMSCYRISSFEIQMIFTTTSACLQIHTSPPLPPSHSFSKSHIFLVVHRFKYLFDERFIRVIFFLMKI